MLGWGLDNETIKRANSRPILFLTGAEGIDLLNILFLKCKTLPWAMLLHYSSKTLNFPFKGLKCEVGPGTWLVNCIILSTWMHSLAGQTHTQLHTHTHTLYNSLISNMITVPGCIVDQSILQQGKEDKRHADIVPHIYSLQ